MRRSSVSSTSVMRAFRAGGGPGRRPMKGPAAAATPGSGPGRPSIRRLRRLLRVRSGDGRQIPSSRVGAKRGIEGRVHRAFRAKLALPPAQPRDRRVPRPAAPPSPARVFLAFLALGLTSFGGPVTHIGYFREAFVARRGWLGERGYADLVAPCQMLPGPTSSRIGIGIGVANGGHPPRPTLNPPPQTAPPPGRAGRNRRLRCRRGGTGRCRWRCRW